MTSLSENKGAREEQSKSLWSFAVFLEEANTKEPKQNDHPGHRPHGDGEWQQLRASFPQTTGDTLSQRRGRQTSLTRLIPGLPSLQTTTCSDAEAVNFPVQMSLPRETLFHPPWSLPE